MLISELTKQITQSFTVEQVLGLTDMLSQVPNQGVKNHHYVNLGKFMQFHNNCTKCVYIN